MKKSTLFVLLAIFYSVTACDNSQLSAVSDLTEYYDEARSFENGLAAVKKNGKWGFIDKTGKEVIPMQYSDVGYFNEGLVPVELGEQWGFFDNKGQEVIPVKLQYDNVWSFREGLAKVCKIGNFECGFIDKTGQEVIPVQYKQAMSFHEGLAVVSKGEWGIIDKTGREIVPLQYNDIPSNFINGLSVVEKDNKWKFIDRTGKEVFQLQSQYSSVFLTTENIAVVIKDNWDKWGIIDLNGNEITPLQYNFINLDFQNGLTIVAQNNKYGVIDKTGKEVIPVQYDAISIPM